MLEEIVKLALNRVMDLGQEAFTIHEDMMKWKPEAVDPIEKTKASVNLKTALEEQRKWIVAILESEDRSLE